MIENKNVADAPVKNYEITLFPSGEVIDIRTGPRVEQIHIQDMAHAMACINRYNGHREIPISDAEHSNYVCELCDIGMHKLYYLFHDSPEYIYHDLTKPFKNLLEDHTPIYDQLTQGTMKNILTRFGLSYDKFLELYPAIKKVDLEVYELERRFRNGRSNLPKDHKLHGAPFGMPWQDAENLFLTLFEQYIQ